MNSMLAAEELSILQNQDFLLAKQQVQEKLWRLLEEAQAALKAEVAAASHLFPEGTELQSGKISKGEQYRGLPYMVLDFPKKFAQADIFTFRTMVWWGNECSCTLHLQGHSAQKWAPQLLENLWHHPQKDMVWLGVGDTPWEYHFGKENYQPLRYFNKSALQKHLFGHPFIKLSQKLSLQEVAHLPSFSKQVFQAYIYLLDNPR